MATRVFAAEVRDNIAQKYFEGKADLNYVMRNAIAEKYYTFSLDDGPGKVVILEPYPKNLAERGRYFPDPGLFSRTHTHPYNVSMREVASHTFRIDGNWEASDISYFHARITNLYALFSAIKSFNGRGAEDEREYVRHLIQERFWRGGGSYLGFYGELYEHVRRASPLTVASIQYNSPGQIVFKGDGTVFAEIDQIIDVFDNSYGELRDSYGTLHGVLSRERLLRPRPESRFSTDEVANYVIRETRSLAEAMKIEKIDELYEACDRNIQVFCKVILSVYRRAHELYTFHAEGRVQIEE